MVKKSVAEIDADQPVTNVMSMDELLAESIGDWRFFMRILGLFAGLAVMLAVVGIYGVMSYSVNERTHEIGVRMALGAQREDVLGLVTKLGLKLTGIGVGIGILLAFGLTRLMSSILYGVKPSDPTTYAAVGLGTGVRGDAGVLYSGAAGDEGGSDGGVALRVVTRDSQLVLCATLIARSSTQVHTSTANLGTSIRVHATADLSNQGLHGLAENFGVVIDMSCGGRG